MRDCWSFQETERLTFSSIVSSLSKEMAILSDYLLLNQSFTNDCENCCLNDCENCHLKKSELDSADEPKDSCKPHPGVCSRELETKFDMASKSDTSTAESDTEELEPECRKTLPLS